ncbi:speckle-type POZ protein-like [Drosophila montana]|uniref:speckle-type POZ protein-like n=1 Tax=Drosophila montana TaxID=40370 RepID=UPI00313C3B1E
MQPRSPRIPFHISYSDIVFVDTCQSDHNTVTYSYLWTIENYQAYSEEQITYSPHETLTNEIEFKLELETPKHSYDLSVHFVPKCSGKERFKCKVCVWIPADKEKSKSFKILTLPESAKFDLIKYNKLSDNSEILLEGDKLTIACEIIIFKSSIPVLESKLADDLGALLEEETLSDVTIVTGDGQKIKAHRLILSARSPVFMAMFKHPSKENELGCITIPDFNYNVIREMLRFIYTDQKPNMADIIEELLAAADKYCLDRLKAMCADFLLSSLSAENAAKLLKLADLYNMEYLKSRAVEFIKKNIDVVWETPEWKQLLNIKT